MSQVVPQNFRQLLSAMPAAFRQSVVESLLSDKEAKSAAQEALQTLAALRKMRPQTLGALSRADRAKLVLGSLGQPAMETAAMQSFQVWFLRQGRELMSQMLDAWKVPHTQGELADDVELEAIEVSAIDEAAAAAAAKYPREAVAAYLGYNHLAPPSEKWVGKFETTLVRYLAAA